MKNKEKYAKEIIEIAEVGHMVAVNRDGEPCDCAGFRCDRCILRKDNQGSCNKVRKEWFEREAKKTLTDIINEEIERIEKITRGRGGIAIYNNDEVVDILKRIQRAVRQEVEK